MLFRALLVIASGFIFIFSPGLPMSLIGRFNPGYKRDLVYWGIGTWLVANFLSQFTRSLIMPAFYPDQTTSAFTGKPLDFIVILMSAFLTALFLGIVMRLVLGYKRKKNPQDDRIINGLALGFGGGLIAQVFTGITLVGAGFQVLFGNTASNVTVSAVANSNLFMLLVSLITLIVFRIALLCVSAMQGVLTAQSMDMKKGQFWMGVLIHTLFTTIILTIQLLMGEGVPGQVTVGITPTWISVISSLYYLLSFAAAYIWLSKQLQAHNK
jgi:hypothetical protein